MVPYLHFSLGDVVWFQGWVPQSRSALIGTCMGLLLLAVVDRWIAACRTVTGLYWDRK
jgi:solute carrier family 31 (copper transporter), member 1